MKYTNYKLLHLKYKSFLFSLVVVFLLVSINFSNTFGQQIPSDEKFEGAIDFIVAGINPGKDINSDTVKLYNSDGSLWYEYSLSENNLKVFKKQNKIRFKPFYSKNYSVFLLRAVSTNWYKVEINKSTKETKYMKVSDDFLKIVGIKNRIKTSISLECHSSDNLLRKKPNGQIIEDYDKKIADYCSAEKFDGDWLRVSITNPNSSTFIIGWIKWKANNNLLINFDR